MLVSRFSGPRISGQASFLETRKISCFQKRARKNFDPKCRRHTKMWPFEMSTFFLGLATFYLGMATFFLELATFFLGMATFF